MCIVQEKLLIKKKIWANYMTKLKEPIYEFDVNIHYLPIYIKKKNVYCPSKTVNQEKNNMQTIRLN